MRCRRKCFRSTSFFWGFSAANGISDVFARAARFGLGGAIGSPGDRRGRLHGCGSWMDTASDSELLERARQGRADAFSALVRRHDRYLYRLARSILRDDQEAEDVVQQTYLKAFTKIGDFRGEATLRTLLTRIALNEALRRKRRRSLVEFGEIDTALERVRSHMYLCPLTQATPEAE